MKKRPHSTPYFFDVNGQSRHISAPVPIVVRKRKRARSMVLRYQPLLQALTLTLPYYVSIERGLKFVEEKRQWVIKRLEEAPPSIVFADGENIPFLGQTLRLRHVGGRGLARREEDALLVSGDAAFMARRVREWLKKEARAIIADRAKQKARAIGRSPGRISVRDTRSLWGSCTEDGNLSFSWRLVLAPPEVLDYLVAHEVAHLAELNHGKRFWNVVAGLCHDWQTARAWLKRHGDTLYRYG